MELTRKLYEQAVDWVLKGEHLEQAENILNAFLNEDRRSAILYFYLGCVQMKKSGHFHAALLFSEAIKYKCDFVEAYNNLGYVLKKEQLVLEARAEFEKAVKIAKAYPDERNPKEIADYVTSLGSTYISNGTPAEAVAIFGEALELNPDDHLAKWNRSLANLELGNYAEGFGEYDFGDRTERCKNRNYNGNAPLWDGTKGQTVVVYGEQGLGDELMFATMLPDIMQDCKVILDAHPRLVDLFRESFPTVPVFGTRKMKIEEVHWAGAYKIDARIGIGSLGKFYRKSESDFPATPYLKPSPRLVSKYKQKLDALGDKPKIGISWRGGIKSTNTSERFIKAQQWLPLLSSIDADFFSLQYTKDAPAYVAQLENECGIKVHHWQDAIDDYDETAGLIANLDLIISVPQSVVHLAGAMGIPTWQLTPKKAMWQMGPYGKDMPWYGCVKNVWQDETCTWEPVIELVKEELCNLFQMSIAA